MNIANFLIQIFFTLYTLHLTRMIFSKKQREGRIFLNKRLNELRAKPIKTIEEQREFVNMRYPKLWGTFKLKEFFKFKSIITMVFQVALFIFIVRVYIFLFLFFDINLKLWMSLAIIFTLPICLNYILKKFGVQLHDISVFFK